MLNVGDGRGQERAQYKKLTRAKIISFFERNPGATKTQCALALSIHPITVARHIKEINGNK
jgi:predicted ArsR family transcriptional regulator